MSPEVVNTSVVNVACSTAITPLAYVRFFSFSCWRYICWGVRWDIACSNPARSTGFSIPLFLTGSASSSRLLVVHLWFVIGWYSGHHWWRIPMVLAVPRFQIMFLGSMSLCASNRRYMPHSRLVVGLLQNLANPIVHLFTYTLRLI